MSEEPAPEQSSSKKELLFFAALIAGLAALVFGVARSTQASNEANYLILDAPGAVISVRVDGKPVRDENELQRNKLEPGERHPFIAALPPGSHQVEILDEGGEVLETTTVVAPEKGLRAVYAVGEPRDYVLATVAYGSALDAPALVGLEPLGPKLSLLPPLPGVTIRKLDVSSVNRVFGKSITTKARDARLRSLCTLSPEGEPECTLP